jgi:hypothetical protein
MNRKGDWYPSKMGEQVLYIKNWISILSESAKDESGATIQKYALWGIPQETFTDFVTAWDAAGGAWQESQTAEKRTSVIVTRCKVTFKAMEKAARNLKKRYFYMPPLLAEDLTALGLRLPDEIKTAVMTPTGVVSGKIELTVAQQLTVVWELIEITVADPRADYGVRIYMSVVTGDPEAQSALTGRHYYLPKPPTTPMELHESEFTRLKKHIFQFAYEDSGKTAYFCIRVENAKGGKGPWGVMFSAVIP